jgi:hypothetical protein
MAQSRYSTVCLEELRKIPKNFRIAGVPAAIRAEHLPNTNLDRYRHVNLLGTSQCFSLLCLSVYLLSHFYFPHSLFFLLFEN